MPLQFNELIILESFISQEMLIKNIANHYKYQVSRRFSEFLEAQISWATQQACSTKLAMASSKWQEILWSE